MPDSFRAASKQALLIIIIATACLLITGILYQFSETWQFLSSSAAVAIASLVMLLHKEES